MLPASDWFCTVLDVSEFLHLAIEGENVSRCARAISEATEAIRNYCHQFITEVDNDAITLDVGPAARRIFLPELPVTDIASVVEDGDTLVEGDDEDYQLGQHGILHRVGAYWAEGIQIVTVTYTHGYDDIPQDIIDVCTRAASRAYQAGLLSAETAGVVGVQAMSLGDYSVQFGLGGGGVSEGLLGASGARFLLLSEKDALNRYRYIQQ